MPKQNYDPEQIIAASREATATEEIGMKPTSVEQEILAILSHPVIGDPAVSSVAR